MWFSNLPARVDGREPANPPLGGVGSQNHLVALVTLSPSCHTPFRTCQAFGEVDDQFRFGLEASFLLSAAASNISNVLRRLGFIFLELPGHICHQRLL